MATRKSPLALVLARLARQKPGSASARQLTSRSEHAVMKLMKAGGKRGTDSAVRAVRLGAHRFKRTLKGPGISLWRLELDGGVPIELWYSVGRMVQMTWVHYGEEKRKSLTPAQQARHDTQQAFYKRYTDVGQRWYRGHGPRRLPTSDNVILLIGELEADVNNGGFSQYLDNKGWRRARAALAALRTVGARKTANMLATAMAPAVTPTQLDALDARFYRVPEDLAVVTMRWVRRRAT